MLKPVTPRVFVDGLLGLMVVATLTGWMVLGRNNPHGLGTIALVVELAPLVAVVVHAATPQARRGIPSLAGQSGKAMAPTSARS